MRRSAFLKLSSLGLAGFGLAGASVSPLERWMRRFGAVARPSASALDIAVALPPERIAEAMHSLARASDGALRCLGAEVRGRSGPEAFVLRFV